MVCTLKSYLFLLQRATFQMVVEHRKKTSQIIYLHVTAVQQTPHRVIKGPIWLTHVCMCVCVHACVYWFMLGPYSMI